MINKMSKGNNLTLWDIDGNLVNVYEHHTPAYQNAIEAVYRVHVELSEIEANYGLPAKEVVAIPVRERGVREKVIQKGMEDVFERYSGKLGESIRRASKTSHVVLPGVTELLERIRSMGTMGIVTGNIRRAGETIIESCGLDCYFDPILSSYADDASRRSEIVSNAIESARSIGRIDLSSRILVFGDTPSDVEAAKENGCVSIAVIKNSNDPSSSPGGKDYIKRRALLEESEPDFLFDDYTDIEGIVSRLGLN